MRNLRPAGLLRARHSGPNPNGYSRGRMKDRETNAKLEALRARLVEAQRKLILEAAELVSLPSDNTLSKRRFH